MPVEIERKFLVCGEFPRHDGVRMVQAYLCKDIERMIRVRMEGERAVITIKGASRGITRAEYEYEIPLDECREMMKLAIGLLVEKTRYYHRMGNHTWEIDVFSGANEGLVIAEVELNAEDEAYDKPDWVGEEVTADHRYANAALSEHPYSEW